ncbi:putative sam domain-containing protein [Phaeoacremonium minimum UCRPA7]|uniref:Putative sam domain-containing protein n=1 Tax=Phaeoacremonium minimum (strain UCR-PA7) TaxID=1286976 RepID=R8BVU9_PHAM7|nr:putative sam domain-containing protein [Phaeoacremonium minimum UCRPA7]EOO03477.1 putative sam domain-containing protein [Phaeoacremonium minimum UCRPA7]
MAAPKPDVGDILLVIHDFQARSSDELTLAKGDRVELIERDDEFGDGWFLGKHLVNGNSGLFPEVYTRPAPKGVPNTPAIVSPTKQLPLPPVDEGAADKPPPTTTVTEEVQATPTPPEPVPQPEATPAPLPLNNFKSNSVSGAPVSKFSAVPSPPAPTGSIGDISRLNTSQDSQVLHETLNVINEHITDLRSAPSNGALRNANDSGSEYSSHIDHRMSYIQGEETDEEEEGLHSRSEVQAWSSDQVAEYLFTAGVEKHHCEVFRDQEITGEVILGMDQTSVFIKAFDLGSVGRRLKTWQKIKALQDEVNGQGPSTRRTTQTGAPPTTTPKLATSGTFPQQQETTTHKKQPSFDRNWTLGSASAYAPRPLSSAGFQDIMAQSNTGLQDSAVDLERGYFSGTEVDGRKRNVLKKRDSAQSHTRKTSYAEEQRVRSATALSRHSRFGSIDSVRQEGVSPAAQKYYGMGSMSSIHRRTASTSTHESAKPPPLAKDGPSPTVTKLEDAVTGHERSKLVSPIDSPMKDSPLQSPSRTGSSTPSAGPSFELDSPDATKSPSTAATVTSRGSKKKGKKETSAYQRGLLKISPREAITDADYSGWMKKKSSNLMTTWKPRLFVLKGRRLAYYYSEDDDQEKGLIDISFHRVLPADNERLTGLHATITGASNTPTMPAGSHIQTLATTEAERDTTASSDSIFIFKLVPPRAGLSRAVNFTKPTVHYFAVPNIKQGRLWMAALMKATIDRDDNQPITTTYQQKTISLAKARAMRHRPPALMNLDEKVEDVPETENKGSKEMNGLGITIDEEDTFAGLEKLGLTKVESARARGFPFETEKDVLPQSA